jgi:hypothetical protein
MSLGGSRLCRRAKAGNLRSNRGLASSDRVEDALYGEALPLQTLFQLCLQGADASYLSPI